MRAQTMRVRGPRKHAVAPLAEAIHLAQVGSDIAEKPGSVRLACGNAAGESWAEVRRELEQAKAERPDVHDAVRVFSLFAKPTAYLTGPAWADLVEAYMADLGYLDSVWAAWRHRELRNDHVRIVACRVMLGGKLVPASREHALSREALEQIEREYEVVLADHRQEQVSSAAPWAA